jgi:hypothetical protein
MSVSLDTLNHIADALQGVAISAQTQGNISTSAMRKMSDDIPQLYNIQDKGSLITYLRQFGKRHPVSFAICESLIYQISSQ